MRTYYNCQVSKPVGGVICQRLLIDEWPRCRCRPTDDDPCGVNSECWNRMLQYECHPSSCPAGNRCGNRAFQLRLYPSLVPVKTDHCGWGLKTLVNIPKVCVTDSVIQILVVTDAELIARKCFPEVGLWYFWPTAGNNF